MKLIFEEPNVVDVDVQEIINESTGKSEKKYYITGLFTTTNEKNRNNRVYPKELFEKELNSYQNEIKNNTPYSLMEYEHPPRSTVDLMEAVAKITELNMVGNKIYGKAVLLDNQKANQLKTLIDNGIKIGVSSRGLGRVKNGIVTEYKLITYDIVSNPSNRGSYLERLQENYEIVEGILQDKEYEVLENGTVQEVKICNKSTCQTFNEEIFKKTFLDKFKEVCEKLASK